MKVFLIGSGPGDPGLLTLKAKAALSEADTIVYDYLAPQAILEHCNPEAEIIYVGKKGGDHTLPQDKINDLLVAKAKEGKVVARLKGGDPYIFGRGAEEAEELLEAGVPFEVIPGVTSAVAAPAYAGIPLTHRKFASCCCFITGHEDPSKPESALDWEVLARFPGTLVFFMGMKNLPHIAGNLVKNGMPKETPAALVRWGTTCRHRSLATDLEHIAEDAKRHNFGAPSLIVVGHVVSLRDTLNFFEQKPLLGKGVVVTRAREQASELADKLQELGACCIQYPTIEIQPLDDYQQVEEAILALQRYDWLVFTSVNGVKYFWKQLELIGLDSRILAGCEVAAIGPATAAALKQRGINADFVPPKYVAESVVKGLLERGIQGKNVLIPRAKEAREVLPDELGKAGCQVDVLPVYETVLARHAEDDLRTRLEAGEVHCITFASSSTVENFFQLLSPETFRTYSPQPKLACIGPVTVKTLERFGFKADIQPEDFTIPALVQAVSDALGENE